MKRTASETDVAAAPAVLRAPGPDTARPGEEAPRSGAVKDKTLGMTMNKPEPVEPGTMDKVAARGEREAPVQPTPPAEPAPAPSPVAAPTVAQPEGAEAARGNDAGAIAPAAQESRRAAPAPSAAALARDESPRGVTAPTASRPGGSLRPVPMDEAVRILGGSIRLVDGMTPIRILAGEAHSE